MPCLHGCGVFFPILKAAIHVIGTVNLLLASSLFFWASKIRNFQLVLCLIGYPCRYCVLSCVITLIRVLDNLDLELILNAIGLVLF